MALTYYVLDLETTGLSVQHHEITQISIIRCSDKVQFSRFIKPQYPERASYHALVATGRTPKDLEKGDDVVKVSDETDAFLQQDGLTPEHRCCVIHSTSGFDRRFLHSTWRALGKSFPAHVWFDTEAATRDYFKQIGLIKQPAKLGSAVQYLGISIKGKLHDAKVDTQACFKLRERLLKEGIDHLKYLKRVPQE